MVRARLVAFALLTSILAACSSVTAPQQTQSKTGSRALRDSVPCDSLNLSGYTNPGGHC